MTHALEAANYEPYGDVKYADPGYQSDKKKRYPLDSEEHCRAAWSYINQADNAAKYTPAQLKRIKSRIKAAGRKYGIDFADDKKVSAAAAITGVELARPGTWKLRSGQITVTPQMLDDAARFAAREGASPGYLKIGHALDGQPAASLGDLSNLRVEQDEDGEHVLLGDLVDLPDWLAAAAPTHWPSRSIEGWQDFEHDGQTYGLVVHGLALLGLQPPGIESLRGLPPAAPVAASATGRPIVASFGDPPAPAPVVAEVPSTKGSGMSLVKYREALAGLPDDASDEDVQSALAGAGFAAPAPPEGSPVTAAAPGTVILASSVWDETQETIKRLTAFVQKTERDERDQVIARAVQDGKFTPAQRPHFSKLWDADPNGTRTLIDSLTRNSALAVMASGYAGDGTDEEFDAEFGHLFPPTGRSKEASRG